MISNKSMFITSATIGTIDRHIIFSSLDTILIKNRGKSNSDDKNCNL